MKFELDAETARALATNLEVRNMVESEGWRVVKQMLIERIALLSSVTTLPENMTNEQIGQEAMFRAKTISVIMNWLEAIEGRVDQANQQYEATIGLQETTIVREYKKQ